MSFADSYLGKLRAVVGSRLLMVPGTRVHIEDAQGRFLMQHRADLDVWGFPGGNAEEGEALDTCIVREVQEETGMTISDAVPFAFASNPALETVTFPNGDQCQFYVLMFWTRTFLGTPRILDDESLALEWFAPNDMPAMMPTMQRGFDALLRFQTTGQFQVL